MERNSDAQKLKCFAGKPSSDAEHPDYVPSIFVSMKNKGSSSSVNRYNRQVKRREVWNAPLTVSCKLNLKEWVRRLAEVLKKHIRVPSKQQYRRRVPAKFLKENWSRVTALIDCSEIFIDRAFNLDARALTFSEYKSHDTVKFLIACTPLSKVSFVSKLFGGRTSDKQILQLSGFLEQIRPGDVIFADRGFPVKDLVAERGASLVLPASTKGKKQLSSAEKSCFTAITHDKAIWSCPKKDALLVDKQITWQEHPIHMLIREISQELLFCNSFLIFPPVNGSI
ncbi:uncharacterized protein TNCV_1009331 [Trichonephila clavipes]|nr:uncharacterized protein TNCV_1009331 [Trichonephila clavipes]